MFKQIILSYARIFPDENLETILAQIDQKTDTQLIDRKNYDGHFTASVFVISRKTGNLLLHFHKNLGKYLQFGGHIDEGEEPFTSAVRETKEESGLEVDKFEYLGDINNKNIPQHIEIFSIPKNPRKNEEGHTHFDLQYLFFADDDFDLSALKPTGADETIDFKWVSPEEFSKTDGDLVDYRAIVNKINHYLD